MAFICGGFPTALPVPLICFTPLLSSSRVVVSSPSDFNGLGEQFHRIPFQLGMRSERARFGLRSHLSPAWDS